MGLRFVRAALVALVVIGASPPSCKGAQDVSFKIQIPNDVVGQTVWFEVAAYKDTRCSALAPMLMDGVPDGAAKRVAFRKEQANAAPKMGDLSTGSYAFAAVARGEDCGVLATGCSQAELGDDDSVSIPMAAADGKTGTCGLGAACQAARCVPANDNADPSVGAACSLELLGAGPLANPVGGGGTLVSAPAIATTPSGFVVVYREIDPSGASARVTVLPIDPAGGALDPTRPLLKGRCANSEETDGVGLVMNGIDGKIILARSACGGRPGLELLSFTSKPEVAIDPNFRSSDSPTAQKLVLSGGHVAATRAGGSVVAFTEDGTTRLATIVPNMGVGAPSGTFGAQSGATGAWAAASDKVVAVLSAGPAGGVVVPVTDAGADGGDAGGGTGTGGGEGEGDTSNLSLVMAPAATAASDFVAQSGTPRPPIVFPGIWGALAAVGSRVIVISDGGGPGRSVTYRAFDLDRTSPAETNGFSVEGAGTITTGDVTLLDNKAYIAVLKAGSVSLHVYANATTTPTPLREVIFGKQPRIPSVAIVRDGRVAVAATNSRVAVVWTTARFLTNNDSSGGYAVFACTK